MTNKKVWVRGTDLTDVQRAEVLRVYTNRDTRESPWNDWARQLVNTADAYVPSDAEWIDAREFQIGTDGEFIGSRHTYPAAVAASRAARP